MANDLQALLDRLDALVQNLSPAQRKQLTRELARTLRGSQAKRIRENQNPDGSAMEPRKPQLHLRRRGGLRMFRKLQRTKWLRPVSNTDEAALQFNGFAGRVAREHQYGLRVRVNRSGQQVKMPERKLLGFTDDELSNIEQLIIQHLE